MILPETYTTEWILAVRDQSSKTDPNLIEKMIMALTLVENLRLGGLDFILKSRISMYEPLYVLQQALVGLAGLLNQKTHGKAPSTLIQIKHEAALHIYESLARFIEG